jgi:glycosyltransferase involved in cell wall biosynthesis
VRTVHNLELPSDLSRRERWILGLIERWTDLRIVLNRTTPVPDGSESALIPHGHYRDWFEEYPHPEAVEGRLGYAGLIRRYKGVEELIASFRETSDPSISLTVAGKPSSADLRHAVEEAAREDHRIDAVLHFLDDAELVGVLSSSQLVVLPYLFMHNSGGVLAALSVDRPVLVPDNEVNRDLSAEVGAGWVQTFTPPLSKTHLESALRKIVSTPRAARPDLRARDWSHVGAAHLDAFRRARARRPGR